MATTAVDVELVAEVQLDVADGRYLAPDSKKHWAESVMIAMFRGLATRRPDVPVVLLSDDYDARRVANWVENVGPCHLTALMYAQYLRGELAEAELLRLAAVAHGGRRGSELTASDLRDGWEGLGRVGIPPFE